MTTPRGHDPPFADVCRTQVLAGLKVAGQIAHAWGSSFQQQEYARQRRHPYAYGASIAGIFVYAFLAIVGLALLALIVAPFVAWSLLWGLLWAIAAGWAALRGRRDADRSRGETRSSPVGVGDHLALHHDRQYVEAGETDWTVTVTKVWDDGDFEVKDNSGSWTVELAEVRRGLVKLEQTT
jgi:hypothetical protein